LRLILIKALPANAVQGGDMSTAATRRAYRGPVLFSFGFRPFFLFGAVWSAVAAPIWLLSFLDGGVDSLTLDWHVHEMLFGFLAAVIAGFLTTAVPNWTGRMPIIGAPLAGLFGLWVVGRLAMLFQTQLGWVGAAADCAFLLVFAAVIWREVLTGRNWRNLPVCGLISLFALGNVAFHLGWASGDFRLGERTALAAVMVLIALIGGRIVPSFTGNWMRARAMPVPPAPFGVLDRVVLGGTVIAVGVWVLFPAASVAGPALMVAGLGHLVRLVRWRGWRAWAEPLVAILHLGYAWLGIGLLLLGLSVLWPAVPRSAGLHAVTAGAVGVMTLAVMTRATRGHSGRPLTADAASLAIFIAINLAAMIRVAAPFFGPSQPGLLMLSAALWTMAFGGFAVAYGPMLAGPKRQGPA
jgi:uncharacterized protein involved in response to NO